MPQSQAVQEGKTLVLSCRTRGLPDIRYRWVKNDIEIPGANRSDLVLSSVRMEDFGRYFCRVWDKSGSVTSDIAEVDVFPAPGMSKYFFLLFFSLKQKTEKGKKELENIYKINPLKRAEIKEGLHLLHECYS